MVFIKKLRFQLPYFICMCDIWNKYMNVMQDERLALCAYGKCALNVWILCSIITCFTCSWNACFIYPWWVMLFICLNYYYYDYFSFFSCILAFWNCMKALKRVKMLKKLKSKIFSLFYKNLVIDHLSCMLCQYLILNVCWLIYYIQIFFKCFFSILLFIALWNITEVC